MKGDTKIEEELTCHFKIDMRNLTNFDSSPRKSKKKFIYLAPFITFDNVWARKSTEELYLMALKIDKKLKEPWLVLSKMAWGMCQICIGCTFNRTFYTCLTESFFLDFK